MIGCIDGLMQYVRDTDSFIEIPMFRDGKQVFPHVAEMREIHNGDLLIATSGQGIFKYDESKNEAHFIDHLINQIDYFYLKSIYEDSENNIWIGTENNGLVLYSPKTNQIEIFKYPSINDNNISSIIEDKHGNLLVGTLKNGLSRYDKHHKRFIPVKHIKNNELSISCLSILNDRVLVGTEIGRAHV